MGLAFFGEGCVGMAWARFLPEYGKGGGGRVAVGGEEEDGRSTGRRRGVMERWGRRLGDAEGVSASKARERLRE